MNAPLTETLAVTEPVIELNELSKSYSLASAEPVAVLKNLELRVARGSYSAIMGPSGSGKSTLLQILGCLDTPTSGSYRLAGREVSALTEKELAVTRNRDIGFVFQSFNLLPRLNVLYNVALPLVYAGVALRERLERSAAALERVGLANRLKHRPNQLSGGQRQRVAIARALVTRPSVLLADEPTGNLDSHTGAEVLALFDELHGEGNTLLIVTHEPEVAARTERVITLRDGVIESTTTLGRSHGA